MLGLFLPISRNLIGLIAFQKIIADFVFSGYQNDIFINLKTRDIEVLILYHVSSRSQEKWRELKAFQRFNIPKRSIELGQLQVRN